MMASQTTPLLQAHHSCSGRAEGCRAFLLGLFWIKLNLIAWEFDAWEGHAICFCPNIALCCYVEEAAIETTEKWRCHASYQHKGKEARAKFEQCGSESQDMAMKRRDMANCRSTDVCGLYHRPTDIWAPKSRQLAAMLRRHALRLHGRRWCGNARGC